ncbi:MAG: tetratricopeptide repeat protein [Gammaproteobacteria bacterium]
MDAVWSAAVGLSDNSQEEMDGYDLVVAIGDVLLKRDRDNPALRERMAEALVNKGFRLGALNRSEEAVTVYDEVVQRFGEATEPAVREQVAKALVNKGFRLGALNWSEEEVAVYDEVVQRFGEATEPAVRERVARALFNKGFRLGGLNRSEEEVAVYDEVVQRFGEATEPAVREVVGRSLNDIGFAFLYDAKRMWAAGDEPAARDRLFRAEEKLRVGLNRAPDNPVILGNLGYAAFLSGRVDEARELLGRAIRLGGEELRQAALDDAAIHPLPQDEAFKELVRSIPGPETEVEEE